MIEERFVVTKYIMRSFKREGYEAFSIVGKKGVGKTTFSIKIMCQIFQELGYGEDNAYKLALSNLIFDKQEIIKFLRKYTNHQQPVLCWDDVRAHASGMSYTTAPRETQMLLGLMDTARDSVCGFLMTAPSTHGVLRFIRREEGWLTKITKGKEANWRIAKGYSRYELPSGQMRISHRFNDSFHYKLPDDVYAQVKEKRRHYKQIVINNIQKLIDRTDNQRQKKRYEEELVSIQDVID